MSATATGFGTPTATAAGSGTPAGAGARPARGLGAIGAGRLADVRPIVWLLCAFLFVATTHVDEEWPAVGKLEPTLLLGAILIAAILVELGFAGFARGPRALLHSGPGAAWTAFVVAGVLSVVWAHDLGLAGGALREYATAWMLFPAAALLVRSRAELVVVLLVLCLSEAFYLGRSLQEFLNGRIQGASGLARMVGAGESSADPNSFAATIVFAMPLFVWFALESRSAWFVLLATAYGAVGAFSVVMTRSRSGLVMLGLVGLWTLFSLPGRRLKLTSVILLALFAAGITARLGPKEVARYASILSTSTYTREESTQGRVQGYLVAAQIVEDRPVLGIGPGNWSHYRMRRVDGDKLMPHSLAGIVMAEHGLLGLLLFAAYVIAALRLVLRQRASRRATDAPWEQTLRRLLGTLLMILVLLTVSGLAAHNLARNAWWLVPGLLVAIPHLRVGASAVPAGQPTPEARS